MVALQDESKKEGIEIDWFEHWRTDWVVELLFDELRIYREYIGRAVDDQRRLKDADNFLKAMAARFRRERRRFPTKVQRTLDAYIRKLEGDRARIAEKGLAPWLKRQSVVDAAMNQYTPIRQPSRQVELDGIFRIWVGRIFRWFLPQEKGVSLRTISRLVVLFYICSGLAKERDSQLITTTTGKPLTVNTVNLILSRSGMK